MAVLPRINDPETSTGAVHVSEPGIPVKIANSLSHSKGCLSICTREGFRCFVRTLSPILYSQELLRSSICAH